MTGGGDCGFVTSDGVEGRKLVGIKDLLNSPTKYLEIQFSQCNKFIVNQCVVEQDISSSGSSGPGYRNLPSLSSCHSCRQRAVCAGKWSSVSN